MTAISGYTLWKDEDLQSINTTRNEGKSFSMIASDKLTEKFGNLDVNGSLKISVLLGMVEPKGSAVYLNQKKSHFRESSTHVICQYRTAIKELTMNQLDEGKIRFPDIARTGNNGTATHVVTKIQYGANVTFTFTKRFESDEDEQKVSGELNIRANKLINALNTMVSDVNAKSSGTSSRNENDIECHFQADFQLPQNVKTPTTYEEAIEFARQLIQASCQSMTKDATDGNQPLGVPIAVWLYPLRLMKVGESAPAIQCEIGVAQTSECVRIMQEYQEVEDLLHYLLRDPLAQQMKPFQKKLQHFQQYLTSLRDQLKKMLRRMVVDIRSGKNALDLLRRVLDSKTNDQFHYLINTNRLSQWLKQKHEELCAVKRFQDEVKEKIGQDQSKVLFFPSPERLQEQFTKYPVVYGFEFAFSSLARNETFLEELRKQTLHTDGFNEDSKISENDELWCRNRDIMKRIDKEVNDFAGLVEEKSNDEKYAFALTAPEEYSETCALHSSIIIYLKQKKLIAGDAEHSSIFNRFEEDRIEDVLEMLQLYE
jgi:hypothetical protein